MTTTQIDERKVEELVGRIVSDGGAAIGTVLAYVGDKLGLWRALAEIGPATPDDLAKATGTHERMIREWLSAQAAGGYVTYSPDAKTFSLTPEQAVCLANEGQPGYLGGLFQIVSEWAQVIDKAEDAFRTGKGLGWGDHTRGAHTGTERFFRPLYEGSLVDTWIPALEGVQAKLEQGARVADVGCGHGASTVIMAKAFPRSTFVGFDFHAPSIERARQLAQAEGVADRVKFEVARATDVSGGPYDLVAIFDALHDMDEPVDAAAQIRGVLAPDGTLMLVEPFANDKLEDNLNPVGRVFYGASTLVCTPSSLNDDGLALGAQAGYAKLSDVLAKGGFRRVRKAVETPFNLVLEARP